MKPWKPLALGVATVAVATTVALAPRLWTSRAVVPLPPPQKQQRLVEQPNFVREQSAALFVGVRKFTKDETLEVPYAVDDAVDLAHTFVFNPRVNLVPAERVVIALSGAPQKPESKRRLQQLKDAGAQERPADQSDIVLLLQQQAAAAGKDGILILSFATHGFVQGGTPYVLGSSSLFRYPNTALSMPMLLDMASKSEAARSIIFIDACRDRITEGNRSGASDPRTAAPLIRRMKRIRGQVVFYAAAAGKYAYDDPKNRNGVFTKALVDGLDCKAGKTRGIVTVDKLRKYVEHQVRGWIRRYRDPSAGAVIQVNMDGDTHNMPLSQCAIAPLPPAPDPVRVTRNGSAVTAFGENGNELWTRDLGEAIVQADVLRKYTGQVVALSAKHLWIVDSDNRVIAKFDDADPLQQFVIDRPTARHALKIVVHSTHSVFVLDMKRKLWHGVVQPPSERIARVEILDHDSDSWREIAITTASGNAFYLDFEGKLIDQRRPPGAPDARFKVVPRKHALSGRAS